MSAPHKCHLDLPTEIMAYVRCQRPHTACHSDPPAETDTHFRRSPQTYVIVFYGKSRPTPMSDKLCKTLFNDSDKF
jgi:hypothetical protein